MSSIRRSNSVGAYDAKTRFSELLEQVAKGREVTITRHGSPIARLVPVRKGATPAQRRAAIDGLRRLSAGTRLRGLRVRSLMNEGRR